MIETEEIPTQSKTLNYDVRYVAFIDILEFQELIAELDKNHNLVSRIRALLQVVHNPNVAGHTFPNSDLRARSISDAVAISTAVNADGLAHMLGNIEILALKLLDRGYFLRGAVVKGLLFHDDQQLFGSGFISAYQLESTISRYPRVMLTNDVVLDIQQYVSQNYPHLSKDQIRNSLDGSRHLHILRPYREDLDRFVNDEAECKRVVLCLSGIKSLIERRFDEALDTPARFEKVQWFAKYWNGVFGDLYHSLRIHGPGLAGPYAFAAATRRG
jgi:hypothetical protein